MGRESIPKTLWAKSMRERKHSLAWTVKELANKADVAHGTVVKILQGSEDVLFRHIKSVAKALGLTTDITTEDNGTPESNNMTFLVTIEAKSVSDLSKTIEVEAKNAKQAKAEAELLIARDLIPDEGFDKLETRICDMSVASVEKSV